MKKTVALILALSMVFALCACGGQTQEEKPDAVKNVERLIDGIGEVSLDKIRFIEDAEGAYEQLYEVDKSLVTNYDTLLSARETYNTLLNEVNEEIEKNIIEAKGLAYSYDVKGAIDILNKAERKAVTEEHLTTIRELKDAFAEMLYENTSIVKLEYVYSFQNDFDIEYSSNGTTITAKYRFNTNNSTAGDYSDSLSSYKAYLEKYFELVSTEYDSINAADVFEFLTPDSERVSISRYAKGYPVVGYFVINISNS